MQKITPFLWFDSDAEAAMNFYTSVFPNSRIIEVNRYTDAGPGLDETVITGRFELDGQEFMALNGGPTFSFTEAISFFVSCESQDEVDRLWDELSAGGEESQCGWLKDRFGVSWQIVPANLTELLGGPDPAGAKRAMEAMLQMRKLDIAALQRAYDGS